MTTLESIPRTLAAAQRCDAEDPLRNFRDEFHLPLGASGKPNIYFCGHSLGLQPKAAAELLIEEFRTWQTLGVEGHFAGPRPWLSYHERLTPGLAELSGALPHEVIAMNSLTINLHLLLISFYRPTPERYKILIERSAFPSDRYAVISQLKLHGYDPNVALIEVAPREGELLLRHEDIYEVLAREGKQIATVWLPGVQYLSGQAFAMREIVAQAHAQGCNVGFDLAHAIGNVPLSLHDWNADFAVWCGYKYLNGGPGAIGGAFVHEHHAHAFDWPRLNGWWGHDKASRFAMPETFSPLPGAEGWQVSNPPIFSMTPLIAALEIFNRAGMQRLRDKSQRLTSYIEQLLRARLDKQLQIVTPVEHHARGCQLSLRLGSSENFAQKIHAALIANGIVCDWREPDILRLAPVPLYNTYAEAWTFVNVLAETLA